MEKAFDIKNLTMKFPDFKLGPINIDLEQGNVLAFIGPNGAGKTTTLHCMIGLLKHDDGIVKIFGEENNPNNPEWKYNIGYVGDKHVFYEKWSVQKNLDFISRFYPNWDNNFANELVERFNISLNQKANKLSTGNRAKLSLINALSHRPKLLLLDEPTSGLDPVVRNEFLDVLFETVVNNGTSVFYSSHILSDISKIADELIFIDDGKILQRETKENLTSSWRKITFKLDGNYSKFEAALDVLVEGINYKIISKNYKETINQLNKLGAYNIVDTRMNIEDIAINILKIRG